MIVWNYVYLFFWFIVNWDGIYDYEIGFLGYFVIVGIVLCEEKLKEYYDFYVYLFDFF